MHHRPLTVRTQTDSTDAGKADDNEYMTSTLSKITKWLLLLCGQMAKLCVTSNLSIWIRHFFLGATGVLNELSKQWEGGWVTFNEI